MHECARCNNKSLLEAHLQELRETLTIALLTEQELPKGFEADFNRTIKQLGEL